LAGNAIPYQHKYKEGIPITHRPVVQKGIANSANVYPKGCSTNLQNAGPRSSRAGPRTMQKDLLPLDSNDYVVVVLTFFASALGAAGGIGGGGIMVPMLVSLGGFSVHHAIPLTQATVFGASLMNLVHNFKKRHPDFDRPLIDYHTALMLEVTTLLGTVVGVDLNSTSPVWLITILLIVVLSFTTHRTLRKGLELRKKENEPQGGVGAGISGVVERPSNASAGVDGSRGGDDAQEGGMEGFDESEALIGAPNGDIELDDLRPEADVEGGGRSPTKQSKAACIEGLLEEDRHVPWRQVWRMGAVSAVVLAISIAKGGKEGSFLVQCDSLEYWSIKLSTIPLLTLVAWYCGRELVRRDNLKVRSGYRFQPSEMQWTNRAALRYPIVCITAGIAAGLLGIGGGMLKGPIMLEMGLPPQVVAATAAYMLFWTTASTSIQFGIMDEMLWDYGALLFAVGLVSSIAGQEVLSWFVAKYKKQYFITILIALVIGSSTIFMGEAEEAPFASASFSRDALPYASVLGNPTGPARRPSRQCASAFSFILFFVFRLEAGCDSALCGLCAVG